MNLARNLNVNRSGVWPVCWQSRHARPHLLMGFVGEGTPRRSALRWIKLVLSEPAGAPHDERLKHPAHRRRAIRDHFQTPNARSLQLPQAPGLDPSARPAQYLRAKFSIAYLPKRMAGLTFVSLQLALRRSKPRKLPDLDLRMLTPVTVVGGVITVEAAVEPLIKNIADLSYPE